MILSNRLQKLRKQKEVTQKDVAEFLGMSAGGYAFYERGERMPDPATLNKIAEYFDVSVDYLTGKTNNPNGSQKVIKYNLDDSTEVYFYDTKNFDEDKLKKLKQIYDLVFRDDIKK